jgi:hypothetical protein
MGNQMPLIEEEAIQISTKYWVLMVPGRISSVCSPCDTLRATLVTNPMISHERERE